jgi:hypothetical protein
MQAMDVAVLAHERERDVIKNVKIASLTCKLGLGHFSYSGELPQYIKESCAIKFSAQYLSAPFVRVNTDTAVGGRDASNGKMCHETFLFRHFAWCPYVAAVQPAA